MLASLGDANFDHRQAHELAWTCIMSLWQVRPFPQAQIYGDIKPESMDIHHFYRKMMI